MLFGLVYAITILSMAISALFFISYLDQPEQGLPLSALTVMALSVLSLSLCFYFPMTESQTLKPRIFVSGKSGALPLGLWAKGALPLNIDPQKPQIDWLKVTLGQRKTIRREIGVFSDPKAYAFRREGVNAYFEYRHRLKQALNTPFQPRLIVIHSTEGQTEQSAFNIFNRNTEHQYLGGAWTHFSIDPKGHIYQYGPLNRVSKGQAGIDDQAVGIELVGSASLWDPNNKQIKRGTLSPRFEDPDHPQFQAALDLIRTLQAEYTIPTEHIFSHEDIGNLKVRTGNSPDYDWLRHQVRDRVYLSQAALLGKGRKPYRWYGFFEPYDREDPGRDIISQIRKSLLKRKL